MGRVEGKVALVTGGASGFGEATAKLFVEEGATVVLTDKNEKDGASVAQNIGNRASFLPHDVTDPEAWKSVVDQTVEMHGRLDILMNNAGVYGSGAAQDIENITMDEWRFVNDVNIDGVLLGCQAAVRAMAKTGGGSIVNISSIAGLRATPGIVAYGASKGAVRQLTKSVASYCGAKGYGIRCNSIHPGMVRTPLGNDVLRHYWEDPDAGAAERVKEVPLGELGAVEDIAYAVLFLASDESKHITGAELVIDGGVMSGR